jgi:hypothetical protein
MCARGRQPQAGLQAAIENRLTQLPVQGGQHITRAAPRQIECQVEEWLCQICSMWNCPGATLDGMLNRFASRAHA